MKKQKIALGKLNLNKERITDLNPDQQGAVIGGQASVDQVCQVTVQIACQSNICVTHLVAQCLVTKAGPHCIFIPVTTTKTITGTASMACGMGG